MGESGTADDYGGLGLLMLRAGVEPARVEDMVREFLNGENGKRVSRECALELQALRDHLGESIDALRADQDAALTALGISLGAVRNQVAAMPRMVKVERSWPAMLLFTIIVLQIAVLAALVVLCTAATDILPLLQPVAEHVSCPGNVSGMVYAA